MSQVAAEFQDVPVKQLGRNLEAADRLVALLSPCTDLQTKALLQEHLRSAINQVFTFLFADDVRRGYLHDKGV